MKVHYIDAPQNDIEVMANAMAMVIEGWSRRGELDVDRDGLRLIAEWFLPVAGYHPNIRLDATPDPSVKAEQT